MDGNSRECPTGFRLMRGLMLAGLVVFACAGFGGATPLSVATLNCYWFFNEAEGRDELDKPRSAYEYQSKAAHLIGLLPREAPVLAAFEGIGGREDLEALAKCAMGRYHHAYQTLFVRGTDTGSGQNVGALLEGSSGWGLRGNPTRVAELEAELSRHLVVELTNAVTAVEICVVHLDPASNAAGIVQQREQCRALLRWVMGALAGDPNANVIVLGDFNESAPPDSEAQSLSVLLQAQPPMLDALSTLHGTVSTAADGAAPDRILVSQAIAKGLNHLKLERVQVQHHRHGSEQERRSFSDHFAVTAVIEGRR